MDKFSLKWDDFQKNVTKSFMNLREEKDFFDVTLVTDDEKCLCAHKVVLATSSAFFKNILRRADHSMPMIYLSGVEYKELNKLIEYIYHGEINILKEDLDKFLGVAEKLKIDGLISGENYHIEETCENDQDETNVTNSTQSEDNLSELEISKSYKEDIVKAAQASESIIYEEAKRAADEVVIKVGSTWKCKACDKTMKRACDMRKHAETHIQGLSFTCNDCGVSFR